MERRWTALVRVFRRALTVIVAVFLTNAILNWRLEREVQGQFRTYASQSGLRLSKDVRIIETKTIGPWWMSYPGAGGRWTFRTRRPPVVDGPFGEDRSVHNAKDIDEVLREIDTNFMVANGALKASQFVRREEWKRGSYGYRLRVAKDAEGYWCLFEAAQGDR